MKFIATRKISLLIIIIFQQGVVRTNMDRWVGSWINKRFILTL